MVILVNQSAVQLKKQLKDSINGLGVDDEMKNKLIQEKVCFFGSAISAARKSVGKFETFSMLSI
jgi:hypothetical protein